MIRDFFEFVFTIVFYGFCLIATGGGLLLAAYLWDVYDQRQARLLAAAPAQYEEARDELRRHLFECRAILTVESWHYRKLGSRSPFGIARAKTLRLLNQANPAIRRLYKNNPNEPRYQAAEQVKRLCECCANCVAVNADADEAVCHALAPGGAVFVDLNYRRR